MAYSMCSGPNVKPNAVNEDVETFHELICNAWGGAECMIAKDLPRLAKRTTIDVNGKQIFKGEDFKESYQAVVTVLELLMQHIETDNYVDKEHVFAKEKKESPKENILATKGLIADLSPGLEVNAILRACAQTLVYQPSYEIIKLFDNEPLKDVRTSDGWSVDIRIRDETVQVVHRKKQQKCVAKDDPNHLEVQWELIMTFERPDMVRMTSATLHLVNLNLHEEMEENKVKEWNAKLCGGNLKVR